tara:strand:- start:144 stop:785 length:642 start_codon:yes stop_codon:yes gene_type:complete
MDKNYKKGDIVTVKREAWEDDVDPGELIIMQIGKEILVSSIDEETLYSLNDDDIDEVIDESKGQKMIIIKRVEPDVNINGIEPHEEHIEIQHEEKFSTLFYSQYFHTKNINKEDMKEIGDNLTKMITDSAFSSVIQYFQVTFEKIISGTEWKLTLEMNGTKSTIFDFIIRCFIYESNLGKIDMTEVIDSTIEKSLRPVTNYILENSAKVVESD